MKSSLKIYLIVFGSVTCYLLLMTTAVYKKHSRNRDFSPLESNVARLRLGISESEVDTLMGSAPDATSQTTGVIANSASMLDVTNEQAAKYGPPQKYTLRIWKGNEVNATVAFDQTGKAVCRWTWYEKTRSYSPYSPYQVFKRVGLF
ncbi:MAG: hypothetical protein QM501_07320 [Gimesia sp.]